MNRLYYLGVIMVLLLTGTFFLFYPSSFQPWPLAFAGLLLTNLVVASAMWWTAIQLLLRIRSGSLRSRPHEKIAAMVGALLLNALAFSLLSILAAEYLAARNLFFPLPYLFVQTGLLITGGLVYEIVLLSEERQTDLKVIRHLDTELRSAEIHVLKNELDPHFVYNNLIPLFYLLKKEPAKAEAFASKLIQVYQYFLDNRENDFIKLEQEVLFIRNYIYLLNIRFNDNLKLNVHLQPNLLEHQVLPQSLQTLVENVMKHNDIGAGPITIDITHDRSCLVVSNNLRERLYKTRSSQLGLKNLRARYRVLMDQDITVIKTKEFFTVKIPMKAKQEAYDVDRYHRR